MRSVSGSSIAARRAASGATGGSPDSERRASS
jgi:hypothetical protein